MKLKLLLLFLVLIQINLSGQNYIPFNFENGIWISDWGSYGGEIERGEEQYYCKGDTLIEGNLYNKLYCYEKELPYGPGPETVVFNGYYGAIRNLDNKQVEFISYFNDSPEIIYDFNLTIGDTIKNGYGSYEMEPLIVLSIDSIEFCGIFHKRFNLNDSSIIHQELIEGIGFSSGFIGPIFHQFEGETSLRCYTEKNNESCGNCDLLLTNNEIKAYYEIEIFPNPNSGHMNIRADKYIIAYKVINELGQAIFSDSRLHNMDLTLNINLLNGIYFLEIRTIDQNILTKKIIIEK